MYAAFGVSPRKNEPNRAKSYAGAEQLSMRTLRVLFLVCAGTAGWLILVFVPVFLATTMALRWNSWTTDGVSPSNQLSTPAGQNDGRCPPILPEGVSVETTGAGQTPDQTVFHVGTFVDEQNAIIALAQCGDWIRIQESPPQWLHLVTRTLVTIDSPPHTTLPRGER